jgi:hypothetical protein
VRFCKRLRHGISNSDMKSLFNRGFSTKKNGSGLGLYHANETLIEWGGRIEVNSTIHIGTEVSIRIPLVPPSPWFVSKLSLIENDIVVCIDDSSSVYQVWLERFKFLKANVKLIYCPSKQSFLKEFENLKYKAVTYLIDYEYSGKDYQGFDFTNMILTLDNVKNRIIMVSSRSSEEKIQDYCIQNSIHIIPKNFSVKIPLEIFDTSIKKVILVAICDKYTNQLDNCEWHKYSNANDLISDLPYFNSSYQVFIQRNVFTQHLKDKFKKYEIIANEFDKILDLL